MAGNRLAVMLEREQRRAGGRTGLAAIPAGWTPSPWQYQLYQWAYAQACEEVAREVWWRRLYSNCRN